MSRKTKQYEQAVAAILEHPRLEDAAQSMGVSYVTLWRWLQDPDLRNLLAEARRQLMTSSMTSLQKSTAEAVIVLKEVMMDSSTAASSRIGAARTILEQGLKGWSAVELEERLQALEERIEMLIERGVRR